MFWEGNTEATIIMPKRFFLLIFLSLPFYGFYSNDAKICKHKLVSLMLASLLFATERILNRDKMWGKMCVGVSMFV